MSISSEKLGNFVSLLETLFLRKTFQSLKSQQTYLATSLSNEKSIDKSLAISILDPIFHSQNQMNLLNNNINNNNNNNNVLKPSYFKPKENFTLASIPHKNPISAYFSKEFNREKLQIYEKLEFGDVIFLKHIIKKYNKDLKVSISKASESKRSHGVVIADSNAILLALKESQFHQKNSYKSFRKALFQIENELGSKKLGIPVAYGDLIQIRHLYTNKLIAIKPKELNEFGGIQLFLDEVSNKFTKFKLVPGDKSKDLGDAVGYYEKVLISNRKNTRLWSIPSEANNEKMEVSCNDIGNIFKLCSYMKGTKFEEFQVFQGKKLMNGDILILKNRENKGLLTVGDWNLRKSLHEKKIKISNADEKFNNVQPLFVLNQLISTKILDCYHGIEAFLQISPSNFNHFWEIQRPQPFEGGVLSFKGLFRLRNLATGLYLALNKNSGKLVLTSFLKETNDTITEFFFEEINSAEELGFHRNVKMVSPYQNWILSTKGKRLENRMNVAFEAKQSGEMSKYSFEICPISKDVDIKAVENISNIFNSFLDFHLFLQNFGMIEQENDQKNTNEFLLKYDYDEALLQEKALEFQIKRFNVSVSTLFEFLRPNNLEIYKQRQLLLKELKIFELLILLARIIDILIFANKNSKEHRTKSLKNQDSLGGAFRFPEKSAFFIARKHLEGSIKEIFKLLGLLIKENPITSTLLLENGDFLTNQIRVYPKEVSNLLKNALRSVSQEVLEVNQQVLEWLSSLESVNELAHNIEDQTELIEILGTALLDNQENSVRINQLRIQSELFSHRGGSEMKRGLLRFAFIGEKDHERPVIIFKKESNIQEFINNNPTLGLIPIAKVKENEELSAFYLDDIIEKTNSSIHIRYISSVLTLIALLINDRNMKLISKINSLGISPEHIVFCLNTPTFPLKLKASYLLLYQNLYLDREPFVSISKYCNRCVLWSNIKDFDLKNPTYYLLNVEDLQNPEGGKVSCKSFSDIFSLIQDFWSEKGFERSWALNLSEDLLIDRLDFIYVFLQVTKNVIDLGYTTNSFNQKIFALLSKMFEILIEGENEENHTTTNSFWLGDVLKEAWKKQEEFDEEREGILGKIFFEATKILKVYYQVLGIVQINYFMKIFQENFEDFTKKPPFDELFTLIVKPQTLIKSSQIPAKTGITNKIHDSKTIKTIGLESQNPVKSNSSIIGDSLKTTELDTSIWMFLLMSRTIQPKILKGIMDVIERYFYLREGLFEELNLIELIDGKKEEELYKELDGTPIVFGQVISPKKLEFQIEKVLNEYDERIKGAKDISQRESKIRELNNVINKLLVKFKETLSLEKGLFSQMQNIIRNLQVHQYIFRLLSMQSNKKAQEEIELFNIAIEFFQLFCQNNQRNQLWVLNHISPFLELLLNKIPINKFLRSALELKKSHHELISPYIDLLFCFMKNNFQNNKSKKQPGNPYKFSAYEILLTLKALLYNSKTGESYLENQKKVLNSLLKHDYLLKFSKAVYYVETRNKLIDKVKNSDSLKHSKNFSLLYHLTVIDLLGHLALDFKLGVLQLQKILIYEQLKALLYDPLTPYFYKKPYLRVLFSVFFIQYDEENSSISIDDFRNLFLQILKDLNNCFAHIECLIKPSKGDFLSEKQKQTRKEILENKNQYMDNPAEEKERQTLHPKKTTPNHAILPSQNEHKKILIDGSEYWKYFYGGSRSFNGRKDGLIMVLLDALKEIHKRGIQEKQEITEFTEKIKKTLGKIKTCLGKIEKDFSINLTKFHLIIHETLRNMPLKPLRKSGLNKNLGVSKILRSEDLSKSQEICQLFLEKINEIILKKKLTIAEFSAFYNFSGRKFVAKDEFIEKTREILKGFGDEEFQISKEELINFAENFMLFKKNNNEMNFKRFLNKLEKIVDKKRAIYQREGLKHEKHSLIKLEDTELSLQKKASLRNLIDWYRKDCIIKKNNHELTSLIKRFIDKIDKENSENLNKMIIRLLEVFHFYGDISYLLKVLEIFTFEIINKADDKIHLKNCLWSTGMIKRVLRVLKKGEDLEFVDKALHILLNCLILGQKQTQEEILKILLEIESRIVLIEFFGFIKMCLTHQELKVIKDDQKSLEKTEITFKTILIKSIKFLALLCENCYQPFQNFFREQQFAFNNSGLASFNIITLTADLLGIIPNKPLNYELVEEILKTLMKYCLGPCVANQIVLSSNKTLFQFLNDNIYKESYDFLSEDPNHLKKIRVFNMSIKLLLSLADANKTLDRFISLLDIDQLFHKMLEIYTERIRPNMKDILNGQNIGFEGPYHQKITETGFDIFILMSILKDSVPNHPKLELFRIDFNNNNNNDFMLKRKPIAPKFKINQIVPLDYLQKKGSMNNLPDSYGLISQNVEIFPNIIRDSSKTSISMDESEDEEEKNKIQQVMEFQMELERCLCFYKSLVGNVEIVYEGVLRKVYFPKPFLSIYLTRNIKSNLLVEARKNMLKSRLEHLLRNIECYKEEMLHFRMIGRLKMLNYLVKSWRIIKDLSLVLIFFIIIFLLSDDSGSFTIINEIVTIIQLILGVFVAIFCLVERYPMSMGLHYPFQSQITRYLKIRNYYDKPRLHKSTFRYGLILKIGKFYNELEKGRWKFLKIFLDYENLYNLLYLAITVTAFNNPYFYSLMLLDIVKRSKILQNIIRAVTNNWKQLIKLSLLAIVFLYIFSVLAFSEFPQRFTEVANNFSSSSYSNTLWLAFLSTVNLGLREQGGFASVLLDPAIGNREYWKFWWYGIWFFILVNILLVKLVFWMIIDTFRVLRERKKILNKEIRTQCFICGIKKEDFELRGNGWQNHIFSEHTVYNYLHFALYLEEKDKRNCNELEKYVKEMLMKKNTEFFPMKRAMALEEADQKLKKKK